MRFCYGMFAKVINYLKPSKQNPTQKLLQTVIMKSVCVPYEKWEMSDTVSTDLLKCKQGLAEDIIAGARGVVAEGKTNTVVEYFKKRIVDSHYVKTDEQSVKVLVSALLAIVKEDTEGLTDETVIDLAGDKTKKELLEQGEYVLSELLAGLFLYSVVAVDNHVGAPFVNAITLAWITENTNDYIKVSLAKNSECIQTKEASSGSPKTSLDLSAIKRYLQRVKVDHGEIKTLIFDNAPVPFYDFYVQNDIQSRFGHSGAETEEKLVPLLKDEYKEALDAIGFSKKKLNEPKRCPATFNVLKRLYKQAIFTGTGGIGKSMLMHHLALSAAGNYDEWGVLPIFVALKDFAEIEIGLYDQIKTVVGNYLTDEHLTEKLTAGECLILLDGYDELKADDRRTFKRELDAIIGKFPENYYYISSRPDEKFINFNHFHRMELLPFTKEQALSLIDKLSFRPDAPNIKKKFHRDLDNRLFDTHREFAENPLLLTIMLLTHDNYSTTPSRMHIFYQEAFDALAKRHDANKGYTRTFKTGLTKDDFVKYFSEFCFRTYKKEKFSFTEYEFKDYYKKLKCNANVDDFLYDISHCLCMLLQEGRTYHFVHRSFQEYFTAVFIRELDGDKVRKLADFFDNRYEEDPLEQKYTNPNYDESFYSGSYSRARSDNTLAILHDMKPLVVESYIFVPFLEKLFERSDNCYWGFLAQMYSGFYYSHSEGLEYFNAGLDNNPDSNFYAFIKDYFDVHYQRDFDDLPPCRNFIDETFLTVVTEEDGEITIPKSDYHTLPTDDGDLLLVESPTGEVRGRLIGDEPEVIGYSYFVQVAEVLDNREKYADLIAALDDDRFILKAEYNAVQQYLVNIKRRQKESDDDFDDLFD